MINDEQIKAVMSFLGSKKSEKKALTSAENGKLGGRPRKYPYPKIEGSVSRQRVHQLSEPQKQYARIILYRAVKSGEMKRPSQCQDCQEPKRLEAHHEDYTEPLVVIWVCKSCHVQRDRARRARHTKDER